MKTVSFGQGARVQGVLFALLAVLMAVVLALAGGNHSMTTQSRVEDDYVTVDHVTLTQLDGQCACDFTLGTIDGAKTLAFYITHHAVTVYVGDEYVYELAAQDDAFSTVGGTWVMIPLYEGDTGKDVRVLLTPLYDDHQTETPEFLLGSESAIYHSTLHQAILMLVLSLCVMFTGFLLICLAVYQRAKGMSTGRLYALGLMAISAGLWRISYDRFAYLLFPNHTVLLYTVSIVSMMVVALSMLNSLEADETGKKLIRLCSCGYCGVYLLQLALQITGVADLRQTLKAVHITIVISAAAFMVKGARETFASKTGRTGRGNFGWLLGIGVIIDLSLYYADAASFHMIFTLVAILCYSIMESVQLLLLYVRQKNALAEMETQLTLSRTTTMMSQIRSHFVFNVLNAISGMCKYDPEKADETVVRFARYLRSNIDIMENDRNIPFTTDLRQLEDYVALEQVRFGDKIEFYTDIEAEDFFIPPLILQPVVENAIKHGLSKKQGNGSIILRTCDTGKSIVITVEDDGVGFDRAELDKETSVGIRNIRFRLEHLVHGTLDIASTVGQGTTVTITIPKEEHPCA